MTADEGIFELRTYHVSPSALEPFAELASRAAKAARKHAELVGQWTTEPREVGRLVELWKFIDFHHRAAARARIAQQSVWKKFLLLGQSMSGFLSVARTNFKNCTVVTSYLSIS